MAALVVPVTAYRVLRTIGVQASGDEVMRRYPEKSGIAVS